MNLTSANKEVLRLSSEIEQENQRHKAALLKLNNQLLSEREIIGQCKAGLDPVKVAMAELLLRASGSIRGEATSAIEDAIKFLAKGCPTNQFSLWYCYYGTKDYDRWSGQRADHSYGCGPRHGSTVFSLGFTADVRARSPKALAEEEVELCLYYLHNINAIYAARAEAKGAVQ